MRLKAENVFKPGAYPEYTYVSRNYENTGISYELRLKQALRTAGCLTSLIGPSKMGKTILCEKVIGFDNIVEISGADFNSNTDVWAIVAAKVGLPYKGELMTQRESNEGNSRETDSKSEKYVLAKDTVIQYYKEHDKVLVIDDFHYASKEMQTKMAQQLKDAIRRELKVVVVSLPHRADDAIRQNADLSGRLSLINIEAWEKEDLKEIALKGFKQLDIKITDDVAEQLAVECLTSPQLMQYICLSICTLLEDKNEHVVNLDILEMAYKFTTINFNYYDVVSVMSKGPNPRGKKRNMRSSVFAVVVSFVMLLIPSFVADFSVLSKILGVLPDQLLQISSSINNFNLYQIGDKVIGAIPILFIVYLTGCFILLPLLYRVYKKSELKS